MGNQNTTRKFIACHTGIALDRKTMSTVCHSNLLSKKDAETWMNEHETHGKRSIHEVYVPGTYIYSSHTLVAREYDDDWYGNGGETL